MSYFDDYEDDIVYGRRSRSRSEPRETKCNRCGSTDVRWRQQGGEWVLFSLQPGIVHECAAAAPASDFEAV